MSFNDPCENDNERYEINVNILKDIFGIAAEENVIRDVLASCNGNLSKSIEHLMKITNANELNFQNKEKVSFEVQKAQDIPCNDNSKDQACSLPPSTSSEKPSMNSYSSAIGLSANNRPLNISAPIFATPNIPAVNAAYDRAKYDIIQGYRVMVLLRGLPGSGKSTLGRLILQETLKEATITDHMFSADDMFMTRYGYKYDKSRISEAHSITQNKVKKQLKAGYSPVIVDNTNTEIWEMHFYVFNAVDNGYIIHVLEPNTPWAFKPRILANKNVHKVPLDKIMIMSERFEKCLTSNHIMNIFKFNYKPEMTPPILRNFPKILPKVQTPIFSNLPTQENKFSVPQSVHNFGRNLGQNTTVMVEWDHQLPHKSSPVESSTPSISIEQKVADKGPISNGATVNVLNVQNQISNASSPLPQRPKKSIKLEKTRLLINDSNDWEQIGSSMSDWHCVSPVAQPSLPSQPSLSSQPSQSSQPSSSSLTSDHWTQVSPKKKFKESSTNTQSCDTKPENWSSLKILIPVSREINLSYVSPKVISPRLKPSLDKGSMTSDEEEFNIMAENSKNKNELLKNMKAVFSHIPIEHLKDILERCNGDFNWAVEVLLDGKTDNGFIPVALGSSVDEVAALETESLEETFTTPIEVKEEQKIDENLDILKQSIENFGLKDKSVSETSLSLKKQIEHNFDFSDDLYTDHVLKLRKKIHGDKSTTKYSSKENVPTIAEPVAGPSNMSLNESSDESASENTIVSLNVGREFVENLQNLCGSMPCDSSMEPIIHMPQSLLNRIHALWMESVFNQMDVHKEYLRSIIREEEEFARQLREKEKEEQIKGQKPAAPNLREIMDMEMALAQYNSNLSEWKKDTPDDLASRLTRQKLTQLFPDIDSEDLLQILNAHNNNFEQTCQVLLVSTGKIPMNQSEDESLKYIQPLLIEQEKDLIARANQAQQKVMQVKIPEDYEITNPNTEADGKSKIRKYRDQAIQHLEIRKTYHNKAMEYFNRGMTQAAAYYSQLAALHTRKHDYINGLAATEILEDNTSRMDKNTLDLHSLYVAEARQVLDMFLDKHIQLLREQNHYHEMRLFLITGRGLHSPKNYPRIKPAVIVRLRVRKIRFYEENPGLLGIYLNALHQLTNAIEEQN